MRKPRFVPADWNLKRIASLLRTSLIIASTTQFSPRVFTYWERYCKAEWDAFEKLKDSLSPEYILEEIARGMTDDELLEAVKTVAKNADISLED